jgi:tagaturonate reductase
VFPVFEALGQYEIASKYLDDVRDRFENPFLAHRLADIAGNHQEKKQRRLKPVVDLAGELGIRVEQKRLRHALGGGI